MEKFPSSQNNEETPPSSNLELARKEDTKDVEQRQKHDQKEHERSVESAADWILRMLEKQKSYGERIPLNKDRSLAVPKDVTEIPNSVLLNYAYRMEYTQKGLYDLAQEISQKHQEIRFEFKVDPEGKWIECRAFKENFNAGDAVLWEPQGTTQWQEAKMISSIQEDPKSKRKFAFFKDSPTGIPLDELVRGKKSAQS